MCCLLVMHLLYAGCLHILFTPLIVDLPVQKHSVAWVLGQHQSKEPADKAGNIAWLDYSCFVAPYEWRDIMLMISCRQMVELLSAEDAFTGSPWAQGP